MTPRTQRAIGLALAIVVALAVFAGTAVFAVAAPPSPEAWIAGYDEPRSVAGAARAARAKPVSRSP